MKRIVFLAVVLALLSSPAAISSAKPAAPQATYELVKSYTGPGGGGSAGIYSISSSIGQPAAGEVSAGNYTLDDGFWGGGVLVPVESQYQLFLPLILK